MARKQRRQCGEFYAQSSQVPQEGYKAASLLRSTQQSASASKYEQMIAGCNLRDLKLVLYIEHSFIFQKEDPLDEILFITRGKVLAYSSSNCALVCSNGNQRQVVFCKQHGAAIKEKSPRLAKEGSLSATNHHAISETQHK
ncbi:hypothetical protein L3X38_015740 [Prunus dulcis]|uniref:Cyclic nucleotide-binding domain-containing protein n=1 Tax=Prunus dulcis TaxID=3755 RepID=A0AAD4Z942_PRUDU|nr:hypothetical protein L3X38_015740 [Prunus dulcis]